MNEQVEVEKFKKLILDMYRGFPRWLYSKQVEDIIPTENMRKTLEKHGFLVIEPHGDEKGTNYQYMLGPNALVLVSTWETEELAKSNVELTKSMKKWTIALVVITIILAIATVVQILPILKSILIS